MKQIIKDDIEEDEEDNTISILAFNPKDRRDLKEVFAATDRNYATQLNPDTER
jgi:hypothetical protein